VTKFWDIVGPELSQETTKRPFVVDDKGKCVQGGAGLGWFVTGNGPDGKAGHGINHEGAWPGERSFAAHRADGGSLAVLVNSDDDAHVDKIINATQQFLNRFKAPESGSPSWKDYGIG